MSQQTLSVEQVRKLTKSIRASGRAQRRSEAKAMADARRASYRVSTEPVSFCLPLPPPLDHYYRTAVIGRHSQTYISAEGKAYRTLVADEWRKIGVTFEGRLAIKVVAVFRDRREPDLDALWKALLDSLQHAGAFENDRQIKAESMEQDRIQTPGWLEIVLGPKPGER